MNEEIEQLKEDVRILKQEVATLRNMIDDMHKNPMLNVPLLPTPVCNCANPMACGNVACPNRVKIVAY